MPAGRTNGSWIPALHGYVGRGYSQFFSSEDLADVNDEGQHPCESLEELEEKWKLKPTQLQSFTDKAADVAEEAVEKKGRKGCAKVLQLPQLIWNSGTACVHVAALVFSFSALSVKLTANRIPAFEIVLVRSILCVAATLTTAISRGVSPVFGNSQNYPMLALRGLVGTTAMTTMYFAVDSLPLPDAITIFFTNPAVTALLAWLILKEQFGWKSAAGCLLSLVGVLLVARPPFIFGSGMVYGAQQIFGVIMAIVSSVFSALAFICVRVIGKKEPALIMALWFHSASFVTSVVPLSAGWPEKAVVPGLLDGSLLVGVGLTSFLGQLLINRGFQLEQAAKASSINLIQVLYSYVFGLSIFGDRITLLGALGSVMVTSGVLVINLRGCCSKPDIAPDDEEQQAILSTDNTALYSSDPNLPTTELISVSAAKELFACLESVQPIPVVCGVDDTPDLTQSAAAPAAEGAETAGAAGPAEAAGPAGPAGPIEAAEAAGPAGPAGPIEAAGAAGAI